MPTSDVVSRKNLTAAGHAVPCDELTTDNSYIMYIIDIYTQSDPIEDKKSELMLMRRATASV